MADDKTARVLVRVEGAPRPIHVSRWMTLKQAEHAKRNHEAMIKDQGSTHRTEIERRPTFAEWLALALGRSVTDDDQWGATSAVLRDAYESGASAEAWRERLADERDQDEHMRRIHTEQE